MIDFTPLLAWLAYAFGWLGALLASYRSWVYTVAGLGLVTALSWAFISPACWFNNFMVDLVSTVLSPLPSTPDNFKIGSLLSSFYSSVPASIGASLVSEVFSGLSGVFLILVAWKIYKALPFT